jgi:hypothetical protein
MESDVIDNAPPVASRSGPCQALGTSMTGMRKLAGGLAALRGRCVGV